ncbi:hypothetical protein BT69DRAFT_624270 [Atractiella rhizophila]|nr:hypothetical protein BT69DRAFT_624270 [Atractiella rhizophila]
MAPKQDISQVKSLLKSSESSLRTSSTIELSKISVSSIFKSLDTCLRANDSTTLNRVLSNLTRLLQHSSRTLDLQALHKSLLHELCATDQLLVLRKLLQRNETTIQTLRLLCTAVAGDGEEEHGCARKIKSVLEVAAKSISKLLKLGKGVPDVENPQGRCLLSFSSRFSLRYRPNLNSKYHIFRSCMG